jgi:predicted ArsR family transcriptional regulator
MSIEEKLALLKYAKRELRHLLNEDKYLEIDFIADELGVNKKDVLETIKNIVSEKGKQRREFE